VERVLRCLEPSGVILCTAIFYFFFNLWVLLFSAFQCQVLLEVSCNLRNSYSELALTMEAVNILSYCGKGD
jgi:hypothetical protein